VSRPDRLVAVLFSLAILAALGLFAVYVKGGQPQAEGALLAVALGGIGIGLMVWSRDLMRDISDETQQRHPRPTEPELESVARTMGAGVQEMRRRRFLARLLLAAAGALGLAALFPIRSLGRAPGAALDRTQWRPGSRLVTADGAPVALDALELDSFTTVFPAEAPGSADSQAVLVRVDPSQLQLPPDRLAGCPEGHVAYSKLCTHAGCPLSLYLAATHELRCPCHQSTFDVLNGARPVYGPASRPLPQLLLGVGDDGVLQALCDFTDPAGPSYWDMPR
jgi:ubiquinol-cytochrome c reductase iron-sulfur subunit